MLKNFYDAPNGIKNYSLTAIGEPNDTMSLICKKKSYNDDDDDFDNSYDDDYTNDDYDDEFGKEFDDDDLDIDIDEYVGDLDEMLDENGDFITDENPKKSKKTTSKKSSKKNHRVEEDEEEDDDDDDFYDDDFADFQDNFIPNEYDEDISIDKYLNDENLDGGGYYDDQY